MLLRKVFDVRDVGLATPYARGNEVFPVLLRKSAH